MMTFTITGRSFHIFYKLLRFYYLGENDQVRAEENLLLRFELDPYQIDVAGEYNHWLVPHNRH